MLWKSLISLENIQALNTLCFEFVQKEARIACNPIASPFLFSARLSDDKFPKSAKSLSTNAQAKNHASKTSENLSVSKSRLPCHVCKEELQGITKCPLFASQSMEDKQSFIHQNRLCFGCLRKGHVAKECRTRHICGVCGRRHPTCLHVEGDKQFGDAADCASTEGETSKEVHKAFPMHSFVMLLPLLVLSQCSCHLTKNLRRRFSHMLFLIHRVIHPLSWKVLSES